MPPAIICENALLDRPTGFRTFVDQSFQEGRISCILGPSGSGKSTLLRIVAGLIRPNSGKVLIQVESETPSPTSMVFQDYFLYPHLSVKENALLRFQCTRVQYEKRLHNLLHFAPKLGIDHLLARRPAELSGGERQRAAILKVLSSGSPIWLLDEPLSNLDAFTKHHLRNIIMEAHSEARSTVLWVTHDIFDARFAAQDIYVMNDGRILQSGSFQAVSSVPSSLAVARITSAPPANEFSAILERGSSAKVVVRFTFGLTVELDNPTLKDSLATASTSVLVLIRPQDVITTKRPGSSEKYVVITGKVKALERAPAPFLVETDTAAGVILGLASDALSIGEEVSMYLSLDRLFIFSSQTGMLLSQPTSQAAMPLCE